MILLEIFLANLFLSFHYYLIIYINSSFLSGFFNNTGLSVLYVAGSIINLLLFLPAAGIIKKIGIYRFLVIGAVLEASAITTFIFAHSPLIIILAFLVHQTIIALIGFGLDVFFESIIMGENQTGRLRTMYITVANAVLVICPLIVAFFVTNNDYRPVYILSALSIIPFILVVIGGLGKKVVTAPAHTAVFHTLKEIWKKRDIRYITGASLVLQTFYTWMIIYTPIYLHEYIGFPWSTLGIIFTIMLVPFVVIEIPVGIIADRWIGEKEMMIFGFLIIIGSLLFFPFVTQATFLAWTAVLVVSRIGASFVEATTESYFFKHVNETDADFISIYRATHPLGYIIAPIVAAVSLLFIPFRLIFPIFALFCTLGIYFAYKLKDTK
jgi:MFS family permease